VDSAEAEPSALVPVLVLARVLALERQFWPRDRVEADQLPFGELEVPAEAVQQLSF
jgi:hypothetical protein